MKMVDLLLWAALLAAPEAAARGACAADEHRYGTWETTAGGAGPCDRLAYGNASCGAPLTADRLCRAVACRPALLVGDSLMFSLYEGLRNFVNTSGRLASERPELSMHHRAPCPPVGTPRRGFSLACPDACGASVSIDFERHDHLIDQAFCSTKGYCCDGWHDPKLLSHYATVVTTTGAHLVEFGKNALDVDLRIFFQKLAEDVAARLASFVTDKSLVFVKAHVGHAKTELGRATRGVARAAPPARIVVNEYRWELMPALGDAMARALSAKAGAAVVDPTLALDLRSDCRLNALHFEPAVVARSTGRMVVDALLERQWARDAPATGARRLARTSNAINK